MPFIFQDTIREVIRFRNPCQSKLDRCKQKQRGKGAPAECFNLSMHGITPNGTYFVCSLVYRDALSELEKKSVMALIDAYSITKAYPERIGLKSQIKRTCGEKVEGFALLFQNAGETFGFVTGSRVKIARRIDNGGLINLDDTELLSCDGWEKSSSLLGSYLIFLLAKESKDAPRLIEDYMQGDKTDDVINTDVINAIKFAPVSRSPLYDMRKYLKAACAAIKNPQLYEQVTAVCNAIKNDPIPTDIQRKASVLIIQLLYHQDNEERERLFTEYAELASKLYGDKIPTLMMAGIIMCVIGVCLPILAFPIFGANITSFLFLGLGAIQLVIGGISAMVGRADFYSDNAKEKRNTANSFFNLKEDIANISEYDLPHCFSELRECLPLLAQR